MPPPLPPLPLGFGSPLIPQIEVFIDYTCPFSAKLFNTLSKLKADDQSQKLCEKVNFVYHCLPQPWHPQGIVIAETVLALVKVQGSSCFTSASSSLFDPKIQPLFWDDEVGDLSRSGIQDLVLKHTIGEGEGESSIRQQVLSSLAILPNSGNGGNEITTTLKQVVKYHRLRGIHVTPTVVINGIEAPDVGSGWSVEEWRNKLEEVVQASSSV
jgi:hypothetical protein